jgi:hypothetical protein
MQNLPGGFQSAYIYTSMRPIQDHRVYFIQYESFTPMPITREIRLTCSWLGTGKAPGLEFTFRWPVMKLKDINKWADDQIRTIQISSDVCPIPLELNVRRFVPLPQDSQKRGWMDGKIKKFKETTPFAIVNMSSAVKDMKSYIDTNVLECVKYFLRGADPLIQETYEFAIKHTERHRVSSKFAHAICF